MSEEVESHIHKRFKLMKKIGSGAYGIVWKVTDRKDKKVKALKKNFDAFNNSTDAQRTYREIMFLMELQHPHIIKLEEIIRAENDKDIYLLFEHMDIDLYTLIREGILAEKHKRYILYQMAKSMYYLHSAGLIHRDLKPSNILVNQNCLAKLCDFGLVRSIDDQNKEDNDILTQYIATRWYRAPEILLGSVKYSKAIDIWSFGCLLGEMQKGKPLFPGTSTMNQIEKVLAWTGKPSESDIKNLNSKSGKEMLDVLSKIQKTNRMEFLPGASKDCLDLLNKTLEFDPKKRLTIEEILQHPYLSEFYNRKELINADHKVTVPIDDNKRLSLKDYRALIYQEIANRKGESVMSSCDQTLYRIREKLRKPNRDSPLGTVNKAQIPQAKRSDNGNDFKDIKSQSQKRTNIQSRDCRTLSIKHSEPTKKNSFYKGEVLHSKHLKTLEQEWDPIETKKASFLREEMKGTKTNITKKKRSITQNEGSKRPLKLFPSHIQVRQKKY